MEFLTFLAVPINFGIIMFTGHKSNWRDSAFWKYIDSEGYSTFTVLVTAVCIEHGFIFVKAAMVSLIKDVPDRVVQAENEFSAANKMANDRLVEIKN